MSGILDAKIKEKEFVNKYDISALMKSSGWEKKIVTLVTRSELNTEQDGIEERKHLIQMFLYIRTILVMMVFKISLIISQHLACIVKKDKGIDCVISWKSNGVYSSILSLQHNLF